MLFFEFSNNPSTFYTTNNLLCYNSVSYDSGYYNSCFSANINFTKIRLLSRQNASSCNRGHDSLFGVIKPVKPSVDIFTDNTGIDAAGLEAPLNKESAVINENNTSLNTIQRKKNDIAIIADDERDIYRVPKTFFLDEKGCTVLRTKPFYRPSRVGKAGGMQLAKKAFN